MREGFSANLSVRMSPDAEGGLVLTFDDMTKLISAQRQEAWKDVARRIAHEIKNPLTPIQLSAERLRRKYADEITSDPETFIKCTDTILRQVADIGRMVDEFSSFARMPTPRMAFADMSEVARSTVFGQRLAFPELRIEVEGVDAADRPRLRRAPDRAGAARTLSRTPPKACKRAANATANRKTASSLCACAISNTACSSKSSTTALAFPKRTAIA